MTGIRPVETEGTEVTAGGVDAVDKKPMAQKIIRDKETGDMTFVVPVEAEEVEGK